MMRAPLPMSALLPIAVMALPFPSAATSPATPIGPKMAQALERHVRGETRSCITLPRSGGDSEIIDGEGVIYKQSPHRWFVNVPDGGCPGLRAGRTLVTRTPTARLCRGDIVRIVQLNPYIEVGSCGLGDFVEYTRPEAQRNTP